MMLTYVLIYACFAVMCPQISICGYVSICGCVLIFFWHWTRNWHLITDINLCSWPQISVVYFNQRLGAAHSKTLVKKVIFSAFNSKKLKKQEICIKILQKTRFLSLHQKAGWLFYSQKIELFSLKTLVNQRYGANLKKHVFCKFCNKFLAFF